MAAFDDSLERSIEEATRRAEQALEAPAMQWEDVDTLGDGTDLTRPDTEPSDALLAARRVASESRLVLGAIGLDYPGGSL